MLSSLLQSFYNLFCFVAFVVLQLNTVTTGAFIWSLIAYISLSGVMRRKLNSMPGNTHVNGT
jgi:hypothetical protein